MSVTGNPLKIGGGVFITPTATSDAHFIIAVDTSVTLLKDQEIMVTDTDARVGGASDTVAVGSQRIKVNVGDGSLLTISGALAGTGSLTVSGDVRTETATDGFTGALYVNAGTVSMARENTSGSGPITVRNGGTLALCRPDGPTFTLANPLTVYGNGASAGAATKKGSLTNACAAVSRIDVTGDVSLGGNAQLGGNAAFSFARKVKDNGYSLAVAPGSDARILN